MEIYLKIVEMVVRISIPEEIGFFDEWNNFLTREWGKDLVVARSEKFDLWIKLTDGKTKRMPRMVGRVVNFDNYWGFPLLVNLIRVRGYEVMAKRGMVVLHAGGFVKNNKAVLITGASGSGKSTLLKRVLQAGYKALGEDAVVVGVNNGALWAYSTPFNTKLKSDQMNLVECPVGAVLTVHKTSKMKLEQMDKVEAWEMVVGQMLVKTNNLKLAREVSGVGKMLVSKCFVVSCKLNDPVMGLIDKIRL